MSQPMTRLLVLALAFTALAPSAAIADESACVDGLAAEAGVARPHLVDPRGDQTQTETVAGLINREANDLATFWIGVEPNRPAEDPRFTANFRVDLAAHPTGLMLLFRADGYPYVWARALPDGDWAFESGGLVAISPLGSNYVFQPDVVTRGTVDTATETLSIVLPPSSHPRYVPDIDVVMPDFTVATGYTLAPGIAAANPGPRMLPVQMSVSDNDVNASACEAVLYRAENEGDA